MKLKWGKAVDAEHARKRNFGVWAAVRKGDLRSAAKIISSTWAMKKKESGTYRARINARGFEQREGLQYDGTSILAPVSNKMVIRIVLILMIMAGWAGEILDVQGAFLHCEFNEGGEIHMEVVEIQYLAPLSLYYSLTVAQVIVIESTLLSLLLPYSLRFN
jgi:hypothetical protein